jgi:hypothetical protein
MATTAIKPTKFDTAPKGISFGATQSQMSVRHCAVGPDNIHGFLAVRFHERALVERYMETEGRPINPPTELTLRMSPSFCLRKTGKIARMTFMTPNTLTSKFFWMLSGGTVSNIPY